MPSGVYLGLGYTLVATLVSLALGFGVWQWLERHRRAPDLPDADRHHFARQDARRLSGSMLMLAIAFGMALGLGLNPRAGRADARLFGIVWLSVFVLLCVLLALAMFDWIATRRYASRHRRALLRERVNALQSERQRLARPRSGPTDPFANGPTR
jgi:hypothetical protein